MMNSYKFWGAATVGTKGQVVIPADARAALNIKEGDKMLMMSPPDRQALVVVTPEVMEQYMQQMQVSIKQMLDTDETNTSKDTC